MKIAAAEALWNTEQPAGFSLFQIGGFSVDDPKPSFDIEVPHLLSILATGTWSGKVDGLNQLQQQEEQQYGPGNYMPPVRARVLGHAGDGVRSARSCSSSRSSGRGCTAAQARDLALVPVDARSSRARFPFIAAMAGWVLTEMGRQPWIVQGLLKTSAGELAERQLDDARRSASACSSSSMAASRSSTSCSCAGSRASTRRSATPDEPAVAAVSF